MAYGISIHIGLNKIDSAHYGEGNDLKGCINDANAMHNIAKDKGFDESYVLTDKEGTYKNVTTQLTKAAGKLKKGDILLISYAGHGSSVWDNNNDEKDGKDETWCLYDRMILDDELAEHWLKFKEGVRILMVSDSCHSGSVSRVMNSKGELVEEKPVQGTRGIDLERGVAIFDKNKTTYDATIPTNKNIAKGTDIKATVLLLSGCQDNQQSRDGKKNGLFTEKLLEVYDKGSFAGNYAGLLTGILKLMPANQSPNYSVIGKRNSAFEAAKPFEK